MTDIIEHLRKAAWSESTVQEAADTIEALRAENAAMQAELIAGTEWFSARAAVLEELAALRAEKKRLENTVVELVDEINRLREALKRLVNEVSGSWGAFEFVLRQELGNTNYACVKDKLDAAIAAMGESDDRH